MGRRVRKTSATKQVWWEGQHRFEHWYCDNCVYFITSRVRDRYPAFASEDAKSVFWDRFNHYTARYGFVPWITSLMNNHYHTVGYLKVGENLGPLMQKLHGSVAKLVNDLLPVRHLPFWRTAGNQDYFDGCLRDEDQARRAFRYTLRQSVRHSVVRDHREYRHTIVKIDLDRAIHRAKEIGAFLTGVPYARYEGRSHKQHRRPKEH